MNMYKRREFLENLYFYSLTALTCSVFCCVTLSLPYLSSTVKVFFFVHISRLIPFMLNSKLLFIIGNLIIFALIVNSRILSSTTNVYYDEYIHSTQAKKSQIPSHEVKNNFFEKHVKENVHIIGEDELKSLGLKDKGWVKEGTETWPEKEEGEGDEPNLFQLNKRADEFIARVNRQRKLELSLLQYGSY
ncbi:hypothetical protein Lal_00024032 [Lupinus albus]|nr:hypothetical protein Lal_00024032 [Lupinus albus]